LALFRLLPTIGKDTGRGLRIVKEKSTQKIDQIVALAMACIDATKTGDLLFPNPRCGMDYGEKHDQLQTA
jgi:hypothetical protein